MDQVAERHWGAPAVTGVERASSVDRALGVRSGAASGGPDVMSGGSEAGLLYYLGLILGVTWRLIKGVGEHWERVMPWAGIALLCYTYWDVASAVFCGIRACGKPAVGAGVICIWGWLYWGHILPWVRTSRTQ